MPAPRFDSSKPADNPSPTPPSLPRHKVSRAWLHSQPDIRAAADQLRRINGRSATFPCPPSSGHPSHPLFAVWEPRIRVETVDVDADRDDEEAAIATIVYRLVATQAQERVSLTVALGA